MKAKRKRTKYKYMVQGTFGTKPFHQLNDAVKYAKENGGGVIKERNASIIYSMGRGNEMVVFDKPFGVWGVIKIVKENGDVIDYMP